MTDLSTSTKVATEGEEHGEAEFLKRNMPLIPADTIAGRALVTVIAIMTFLASLAAGSGVLVNDASRGWIESVSREMTIQVKPRSGRDLDADLATAAEIGRATPGAGKLTIIGKAESEKMLEPWLGAGLDLGELPIPRLIVMENASGGKIDEQHLRAELARRVPTASLDDHGQWMLRLATMAHSLVAVVAIIFALVLVAMMLAVAFATRGAMAGNSEIVTVLHFMGAEDTFVAREFQRHFLKLGLRGGIIGGGAAFLIFGLSTLALELRGPSVASEQIEALFGTFALGPVGYGLIVAIVASIAVLTSVVSRSIVLRHLRALT